MPLTGGIIHVNEVAFVCGIESIFRKCTICTSATDLHSFISNLVVLHCSSLLRMLPEVTSWAASICRLIDHLSSAGLPLVN